MFFENAWFVGIATGIISGILVFFLTKWIMDKKGNVEYYKEVKNANQSVINALKPYIADKGLPRIEIFNALISSIARTHGVKDGDMYSVHIFCEELIREIISDVYVSNEKKEEYTDALAIYISNMEKISNELPITDLSENDLWAEKEHFSKLRRQTSMYISFVMAVLSMVMAMMTFYIKPGMDNLSYWFPFDDNPMLWIPIILVLFVIIILMLIMLMERMLKIMKDRIKSLKDEN